MVTAVQPVFAGGRIVNGNRLAALGVEAAGYQQQMSGQNSLILVEKNYWLVLSLNEKRQTVQTLKKLLDTLSRDVNAAYEAGVITRTDLLKVRNELRRFHLPDKVSRRKMSGWSFENGELRVRMDYD